MKQRGGAEGKVDGITRASTRTRRSATGRPQSAHVHTWGVSTVSHTGIATEDLQWKSKLANQPSCPRFQLSRNLILRGCRRISEPIQFADRRPQTSTSHFITLAGGKARNERGIRHQLYIGRGLRCLLCLFYPAQAQCPPWPATWAALLFCHLS